jgi:hypothetical protein
MTARTAVLVVAAMLVPAACGEPRNAHAKEALRALEAAGEDLKLAAAALKGYAYEKRDELKTEMQGRLETVKQDLVKVRQRAAELAQQGKAKAAERVTQLQQQLEAAEQRLRELGDSSGEAWSETRDGMVESWRVLKRSLAEALAEFKKD